VEPGGILDVDEGDLIEFCYAQGWTDGLPVVPPTSERVAAAVEASGRAADDIVCTYVERQRDVSVRDVAANAVMAGCRPEYMPVVLAIVDAMAAGSVGLHAVNATTGGSAIGFIVNGPVRTALGMNCRGNLLGSGNRANSTIGRAVRLVQMNAFGSVPGAGNEGAGGAIGRPILDRATVGQPGKYAGYHIVENEEDYPSLRPLHTERGFAPDDSVVTVFGTSGHTQLSAHADGSAEAIVATLCQYLTGTGRLGSAFCVLVVPPECADIFVRDGWSKADIRKAVFDGTTRSRAWVKENGWAFDGGLMSRRGGMPEPGDADTAVSIARSPDDVLVVVAGGPAGAFVHTLLPYGGLTSRRITIPKEAS
jgi:hypothetical protein